MSGFSTTDPRRLIGAAWQTAHRTQALPDPPRPIAALLLLTVLVASTAATADPVTPGPVIGHLDGITHDGPLTFLSGWACQRGQRAPIAIHVFVVNGSASPGARTFVTAGRANLSDEPAIDRSCSVPPGGAHRFLVVLPPGTFPSTSRARVDANGVRLVRAVPNSAISGSGVPMPEIAMPSSFPRPPEIAVTYRAEAAYPRGFTTPKLKSTVRYLGVDAEDALTLSEATEV